jgi:prepilin-type processing-associated H-X9-DG protein
MRQKKILLAIPAVFLIAAALILWIVHFSRSAVIAQQNCANNLLAIGRAMLLYSNDYREEYPSADKWCDILIEYTHNNKDVNFTPKYLQCPAKRKASCSYAINPNASPSSHPRLVLLFEVDNGWNLSGGPELFDFWGNHGLKGRNILFNDGHVEFVKRAKYSELKWENEDINRKSK